MIYPEPKKGDRVTFDNDKVMFVVLPCVIPKEKYSYISCSVLKQRAKQRNGVDDQNKLKFY